MSGLAALWIVYIISLAGAVRPPDNYGSVSRWDAAASRKQDTSTVTTDGAGNNSLATTSHRASSWKCCKVGEKAAREGMHCSFDIHSATRTINYVHRAKLNLRGHGSALARKYKTAALRVAKCFEHKAIFEKCCSHRATFLHSMRRCRTLNGKEKRECRWRTRKLYNKQ